jgi:DNA-binding transcriptional MerR regulator
MPAEAKSIGEMCAEFGVTPRTLRFYESKRLISPAREGTRRIYSKTDCARLKLILRGKRFGFSLTEIGHLLDLYYVGDRQYTQLARAYDLGVERLHQMRRQRAELDEAINDLEQQLKSGESLIASLKPQAANE